jgi:hypothetical protein
MASIVRVESPPAHLILTEDIILRRCPGAPPRKKSRSMRRPSRYQPHDIALDLSVDDVHVISSLKPRKLFHDDDDDSLSPTEQEGAASRSDDATRLSTQFRPLALSDDTREEPQQSSDGARDRTTCTSRTKAASM